MEVQVKEGEEGGLGYAREKSIRPLAREKKVTWAIKKR